VRCRLNRGRGRLEGGAHREWVAAVAFQPTPVSAAVLRWSVVDDRSPDGRGSCSRARIEVGRCRGGARRVAAMTTFYRSKRRGRGAMGSNLWAPWPFTIIQMISNPNQTRSNLIRSK
jgi:hypothetical protein